MIGMNAKTHKTVKVDWAFRRLRNQAIRFLAAGDASLRPELNAEMERANNWTEVREVFVHLTGRSGRGLWDQFMNSFFAHTVKKHA